MKAIRLAPQFVESIPENLESGVLYVSMIYATAIHQCACGCGREVVTPFSPTDWKLYFDGENLTLEPSIGNWSFPCQSHYWIRGGKVKWAGEMSQQAIAKGRTSDRQLKSAYYEDLAATQDITSPPKVEVLAGALEARSERTLPSRIRSWWRRVRH
jgi:Family of unknown function (DUF6527)